MAEQVRVVVDAMGGDNAPGEVVDLSKAARGKKKAAPKEEPEEEAPKEE